MATDRWHDQTIYSFNPLKYEVNLSNNYNFNSYLSENSMGLHYKDKLIDYVMEIIAVYSENHMKPIHTLYG
jgi:hypothetical protein